MRIKRYLVTIFISILLTNPTVARVPDESFADLIEKISPAVVNISTSQTIEGTTSPLNDLFPEQIPPHPLLRDLPELFDKFYKKNPQQGFPQKATSLGSGFIISPDGYIVTNNHVIENAEEINVILSDERKFTGKVIGNDKKTDIALIKIKTDKKLPFLKWGDSDVARVGDWVIAIGNPFGLGGSVSAGIISARARDINAGPFDDFIQTDAAINRGNSGGPLLNTHGEVIGVNSAIFSPSGGSVGIGFSVPTSLAQPVVNQLKATGKVQRGWLGVKIQTVTDDIAESMSLTQAEGALVIEVTPESPADKAGIVSGDIIVEFDGKVVPNMRKLPRIVAETAINKKVPIILWRQGKKKTVIAKISRMEDEEDSTSLSEHSNNGEVIEATKRILGMELTEINKEIRKKFNLEKDINGLLVLDVTTHSIAAEKGIMRGDVILTANQQETHHPKQLSRAITTSKKSGKKSILLLVSRFGENQFIALPIDE